MNEIKPKKERKFLKVLGKIGEVLIQELFFRVGSNLIRKIGGKKTLPSILFLFLSLSLFAQFPNTGNKQRLGFQTTGDGLVWRGSISDTASIQPINNQNAWVILDTINLKFYTFDFSSNVWNLVGGAAFTQPVDSLFFNVNVPTNNVDTAKMRWDSDLATVVLGLNDNVPNEIGFKNFWLVKNQTGSTITKGSLVYANGTVGASGRITVDKFIANGSIDAKYLLGITAHDLTDGEDGYVISFGKIRQVNTDTFAAGAILYPSPTVAGVWTDVEPVAPNIDMPIGFCINSSANNGTIAIRVASGYKLNELHDVAISSPVDKASLYYSGGLWMDTTAALLVSDTASMLSNYATKAYADTTGRLYARQDFTTGVTSSTLTWTQSDTLIPGGVNLVQVYRNGQILLPSQYTIPTSTSVVIAASSFKVNDNYTVIFPRGGGAGSGGGSGSLTSISAGTGITVSPNPITTTGTVSADLSVLMELTDTSLLNLTSRFNTKQNTLVSGTNIKTVNSNNLLGSGNISVGTLVAADTVSLSNRINIKLNATDTASLSNRINLKLNATDTASLSNRINAKGTGTVTSVATGYGLTGGTITTTGTLLLDSAVVFSRIRDSIVDVAIGNDTIKILKQEYAPATTSVLTWTVTPKFPIQLKQYILVFRNGQLLINDQYNLTDTNKITIVSNSFKVGANYTVVTVSGIGSVGTGVFPNPIYPEAGIALSTGSTWASSIPNNSSNWNVAFNDKITNAQFTGTTTKTLTLTQYDGGTFAPTFTDLQGVTQVVAGTGLTGGTITSTGTVAVDFTTVAPLVSPTFTGTVSGITKSMVGLGNVDNTSDANKPISTATQTALNLKFNTADTSQLNLTSRFALKANLASPTFTGTVSGITKSMVGLGNVDNTSDANKPVSTATQTALNLKFNTADTSQLNLTSRFAGKLNYTDTSFLFTQSDTNQLNLTSRFAAKQNTLSGTGFVKASGTSITYDNSSYLRTGLADSTYQTKLTNPITGTGNVNIIPKFTSTSEIGITNLFENGSRFVQAEGGDQSFGFDKMGNTSSPFFGNNVKAGSADERIQRTASTSLFNPSAIIFGYQRVNNTSGAASYGGINFMTTSGNPSGDINPITFSRIFIEPDGNIGIGTMEPIYKFDIRGTLNATGATTLGSTLAVSGDITENGNNVLTSADTTSMLLPYLRKADTASLSSRIDSKFNSAGGTISGAVTLSTTTATPATLLGKDGSNVVGNVRLTSPLALAGDSLNLGTVPISKGGTGAESASVARTTLGVGYTFYSTTTGATISFSSNRVSLVITGTGSTTTIDLSTATSGRQYMIKNLSNASVVSGLSNVIPLAGGSPTTAILSAGNVTPQWVTLVADGTNWHVMQSN